MRTIKIITVFMFVFTLAACSQGSTVVTSTVSEAAANDAAPTKTEPTIPPTAVPTQTPAPEPTATQVPPTATPEPTATQKPTATPEPSPTPDLTGGGSGKIIFVSKRDGEEKFYIMNYDGSEQEIWADNPIPNVFSRIPPRYSPDGSQIAISTEQDGTRNIFVANADGSGWQQITNYTDPIVASNPVWSPDGRQIAYDSNDNSGIHIINSDGSDDIPLLNIPRSGIKGFPSWSPGGSRMVFGWGYDMVSETYSDSEIFVMNADGSDIIPLAENEFQDIAPVWSPDGAKITFHSNRDGNFEIYVMNVDGSEQTRLTDNDVDDFLPMWSPDGRLIAYASVMQNEDDTRQPELFVMNADGTNLRNLTDGQGGFNPYWLP